MKETIMADYKRTGWKLHKAIISTEFRAVLSFRIYQYIYKNISKGLGFFLYNRAKRKYNVDINPNATIGKGFVIVHVGGIVVGGHCVIGENCSIQTCVTIGEKRPSSGMPTIGDNCYIGTGAKILGNITILNNTIIGANSVVLKSFLKENSTIVGIPARSL